MTFTAGLSFQSVANAAEVDPVKVINVVNTLDYSQVIQDYSDVERYLAILEIYKSEHPNASVEELDDFLSVEMGKELLTGISTQSEISPMSADDLPYVTDVLNAKEKVVFNSNKVYGLNALVAGQKAKSYSKSIYTTGSLSNGNGDAYRHILWNTLMRNYTTKAYAEKFATAHEEGTANNPAIQKQMDLYNNEIGRGLTFNNSGSYGDLAAMTVVQKAVDGGKGKRISNNKLVATNSGGKK